MVVDGESYSPIAVALKVLDSLSKGYYTLDRHRASSMCPSLVYHSEQPVVLKASVKKLGASLKK